MPPAQPKPSPAGTTLTQAGVGSIIDTFGNSWTLIKTASNGNAVAINGADDPPTGQVTTVVWDGSTVWQQNTTSNWYKFTPTGKLTAGANVPWVYTPSPFAQTLVITYQADAQVTSATGKTTIVGVFNAVTLNGNAVTLPNG